MVTSGQILNDTYRIEERLGSGGGGIVYKAYHLRLKKYVAVKLVKDEVKGQINERAETDILKKLKHEGLPQVYDFIADGNDIYTVMEYIDGSSLFDLIKEKGKLQYKSCLELSKELCSAAAYLHTRKPQIIHSDIKPQNIMLTSEGKLCLIDFNISSVFGGDLYTVGSSDGYSPPEQYLARPTVSKKRPADNDETEIIGDTTVLISDITTDSDITEQPASFPKSVIDTCSDVYSIGAVMYSMITGYKPSNAKKQVIPIHQLDENIPEAYAFIVEKAMQRDKKDRFPSAVEMLDALNNIHKLDSRYKRMRARHIISYVFCLLLLAGSAVSIVYGKNLMTVESADKLNAYISEMEEISESGIYTDFDALYERALSEYPENSEIKYYKALELYESRLYSDALEFMNTEIYPYIDSLTETSRSNIYFMTADIYYRSDDYENAVIYYASALSHNSANPDIYRDYAVSLSRLGGDENTDKAKAMLDAAIDCGLSEDGIYYVTGEIQYALGEYEQSAENLRSAAALSEDENLKRNAYLICSQAYDKLIGSGNEPLMLECIGILEEALMNISPENQDIIKNSLIREYINYSEFTGKLEYAAKAVSLLDSITEKNYRTEMNIAILCDKLGDVKTAKRVLTDMLEDDKRSAEEYFTIYVRLAYCEADIQSEITNAERNYSEFDSYYSQAKKIYDENGLSDPEMDKLTQTRAEMAELGWLN
ncbi:MAG: protein kinase [Oscillospiraceae bacterium]|nr:protein kinase [Oscillospiraceae bacterium]